MLKCFRSVTLWFTAGLVSPFLLSQGGSICGTVTNEKGAPAAFVVSMAFYQGAHSGPEDQTRTDENGYYCLVHVQPGEYAMSANDPAMGYPLLAYSFYMAHMSAPVVTVSDSVPRQIANWSIPYKAGFLHVSATDQATGKAIPSIAIKLAIRGSEEQRTASGTWRDNAVLVPPNEDVYVVVTAGGYKPWPSDEPKGKLVTMIPGSSLTLSAAMDASSTSQPR